LEDLLENFAMMYQDNPLLVTTMRKMLEVKEACRPDFTNIMNAIPGYEEICQFFSINNCEGNVFRGGDLTDPNLINQNNHGVNVGYQKPMQMQKRQDNSYPQQQRYNNGYPQHQNNMHYNNVHMHQQQPQLQQSYSNYYKQGHSEKQNQYQTPNQQPITNDSQGNTKMIDGKMFKEVSETIRETNAQGHPVQRTITK